MCFAGGIKAHVKEGANWAFFPVENFGRDSLCCHVMKKGWQYDRSRKHPIHTNCGEVEEEMYKVQLWIRPRNAQSTTMIYPIFSFQIMLIHLSFPTMLVLHSSAVKPGLCSYICLSLSPFSSPIAVLFLLFQREKWVKKWLGAFIRRQERMVMVVITITQLRQALHPGRQGWGNLQLLNALNTISLRMFPSEELVFLVAMRSSWSRSKAFWFQHERSLFSLVIYLFSNECALWSAINKISSILACCREEWLMNCPGCQPEWSSIQQINSC